MRAKASVRVPIRPMYISRMSTTLAKVFHSAQMPEERPQVAKAEVVSKMASCNEAVGSTKVSINTEIRTKEKVIVIIELALSTNS